MNPAFMEAALAQAQLARDLGEIPVGAVIVHQGQIIAKGYNRRETDKDPTAHAEMIALREAAGVLGDWRLPGCTMYVTLEPCPMCAGALVLARIDELVFGAWDAAAGCCGSKYLIPCDPAFAGRVRITGGVMEAACAALLTSVFEQKRGKG